jgi:hypothetical protein
LFPRKEEIKAESESDDDTPSQIDGAGDTTFKIESAATTIVKIKMETNAKTAAADNRFSSNAQLTDNKNIIPYALFVKTFTTMASTTKRNAKLQAH